MPRNVRNFWFNADVDGAKTKIASGPRGRDGGMDLSIMARSNGESVPVFDILARADDEGRLTLTIFDLRTNVIVVRREFKR